MAERKVIDINYVPSVEELETVLRAHRAEIVEADHWTSLAGHVNAIIRACLQGHGVQPKQE